MIERPSDLLDVASETAQRVLDAQIEAHRQRSEVGLRPIGRCYNCDEEFEQGNKTFCDTDCRDDYEYRVERRRVNGG